MKLLHVNILLDRILLFVLALLRRTFGFARIYKKAHYRCVQLPQLLLRQPEYVMLGEVAVRLSLVQPSFEMVISQASFQ